LQAKATELINRLLDWIDGSARSLSFVDIIPALSVSGGFFPLDHQLQLEDPHLSERVSQLEVGQAQELSYTGYLGGPEAFGQRLWTEAKRRNWTQAVDSEVIGDGAVMVQTEAGYFETNKRRMEYLDRRNAGWIIGSGMVESGAKQYQARMTGPGMQWNREGAERMIPIRSAILSNRFTEVWNQAKNSPLN
jgi:hypothetical protein